MTLAPLSLTKSPLSLTKSPLSLIKSPLSLTKSPLSLTKSPLSSIKSPLSLTKSPLSLIKSPLSLIKSPLSHIKSPLSLIKSPFDTRQHSRAIISYHSSSCRRWSKRAQLYSKYDIENGLQQVNLAEQLTSSDFGVSTGLTNQGYREASKWYFVNVERGNIAEKLQPRNINVSLLVILTLLLIC
jgi:hypothetical protein